MGRCTDKRISYNCQESLEEEREESRIWNADKERIMREKTVTGIQGNEITKKGNVA